jgi:hypothetical protein
MTHEELLAKVNALDYFIGPEPSGDKAVYALRAVVELHKPIYNPNFEDSEPWCWQCAEGRGYAKYPCPTIQAIEKELNAKKRMP